MRGKRRFTNHVLGPEYQLKSGKGALAIFFYKMKDFCEETEERFWRFLRGFAGFLEVAKKLVPAKNWTEMWWLGFFKRVLIFIQLLGL